MKKYTVVHLFSGSGGCTLGFQRAGLRSLGSFDFDAKACRDLTSVAGFLLGPDTWVQPEGARADG